MNRRLVLALLACAGPVCGQREYAFDLWGWPEPSATSRQTFRAYAEELKRTGFTVLEVAPPWRLLEPEPGRYDFTFIRERLDVARELGMGLRLRINSSHHYGGCPRWLAADRWRNPAGKTVDIPSLNDERFWERFEPLCTAVAREFHGHGVVYTPMIAIHAELKYAGWNNYDDAGVEAWRKAIRQPRAEWLSRVVGGAELPDTPPVPPKTGGAPDASAASRAWIAFREHTLREAMRRFVEAIRAGDPAAPVTAPLGESYRSQSAEFANLDYWGLSRGAARVVHSYDFFWHAKDEPWMAAASVAAFQGITGLPVSFEVDGPALYRKFGYTDEKLERLAAAAVAQGAALKIANYREDQTRPSAWPLLAVLGRIAAGAPGNTPLPEPRDTILLFISKWANSCYREASEWLHEAQFGAWKMLRDKGYQVRFICEDNLSERLDEYRGLYVAFSPPELLPEADRVSLEHLEKRLPSIVETDAGARRDAKLAAAAKATFGPAR